MEKRTLLNSHLFTLIAFTFVLSGLFSCTPPITQDQDNQQTSTTLYKGYVVQLIASSCAARAEVIKDDFLMDDYTAFVNPLKVNNQLLYRVQIGPYTKRAEALKVLKQLRQHYPLSPHVKLAIIKENL